MVLRDEVWDTALLALTTKETFKTRELGFTASETQTVKRVLKEMEQMGWLQRDSPRAHIWRPGPKYRLITRHTLEYLGN